MWSLYVHTHTIFLHILQVNISHLLDFPVAHLRFEQASAARYLPGAAVCGNGAWGLSTKFAFVRL